MELSAKLQRLIFRLLHNKVTKSVYRRINYSVAGLLLITFRIDKHIYSAIVSGFEVIFGSNDS